MNISSRKDMETQIPGQNVNGNAPKAISKNGALNFKVIKKLDEAKPVLSNSRKYSSLRFKNPILKKPSLLPGAGKLLSFAQHNVFFTNGEKHERIRNGTAKVWKNIVTSSMEDTIKNNIDNALVNLSSNIDKNGIKEFDILEELIQPILAKTLCDLIFGYDYSEDDIHTIIDSSLKLINIFHKVSPEGFYKSQEAISKPLTQGVTLLLKRIFGQGSLKRVSGFDLINASTAAKKLSDMILSKLDRGSQNSSFLNHLRLIYPQSKNNLCELSALVTFFFIAGIETTGTFMANTIKLIEANPEAKEKITCEPDKYSELAIKESLRFIPPTRFVGRNYEDNIQDNGMYIIDLQQSNRDKTAYGESADSFDIERYSDSETPEHLSFSWGPHLCMGRHLTLPQSTYLFQELYKHFDISMRKPIDFFPPNNRNPFNEIFHLNVGISKTKLSEIKYGALSLRTDHSMGAYFKYVKNKSHDVIESIKLILLSSIDKIKTIN